MKGMVTNHVLNKKSNRGVMRKGYVDAILVALAIVSVGLLMYELDHPETAMVTSSIDACIAVIFLTEFISSTYRAPNRLRYFLGHWYDLLASIPAPMPSLRMFRGIRLIRTIRLIRLLRFSRALRFLEESKVGHVVVAFIMVTLFGAIGLHILEHDVNPCINSSLDTLYWSLATVTTVGFGDIVAITPPGRMLSISLMIVGI